MRCFIGYMLPEEIKNSVEEVQKKIANLPLKIKLVERENLHLCFSFLGEVQESEIKKICMQIDSICKDFKRFVVNVGKIKLIPNKKFIRVIALDANGGAIYENINEEIIKRIGGDSKPLHITLGRVKQVFEREKLVEEIEKIEPNVKGFEVTKIQVIKSELSREGPRYSTIYESKLL